MSLAVGRRRAVTVDIGGGLKWLGGGGVSGDSIHQRQGRRATRGNIAGEEEEGRHWRWEGEAGRRSRRWVPVAVGEELAGGLRRR